MNNNILGLILSILLTIALLCIFRYEEQKGVRFASWVRSRADLGVLKAVHFFHRTFDVVGRDALRQILHYFLHSFLRVTLIINQQWEKRVRSMMVANKTLAQNADRERKNRNKLEEIALHKMENALTDEQKQAHRDKMLEG
jgi:hypothetical protein